jgi:hypothetical protein
MQELNLYRVLATTFNNSLDDASYDGSLVLQTSERDSLHTQDSDGVIVSHGEGSKIIASCHVITQTQFLHER